VTYHGLNVRHDVFMGMRAFFSFGTRSTAFRVGMEDAVNVGTLYDSGFIDSNVEAAIAMMAGETEAALLNLGGEHLLLDYVASRPSITAGGLPFQLSSYCWSQDVLQVLSNLVNAGGCQQLL
jgi:hypothetical protein